ncbi:MAG: Rnf-Nqr domain containing protein, partial [Rikenellaceae bacterium]
LVQNHYTLLESIAFAMSNAIGFTVALVLFAGLRERLDLTSTPQAMRGMPISILTAGILAMAFMGFAGLVK